MYKCNECGYIFDEPKEIKTTYESFYGVSDLFDNSNPLEYHVCPYCESQNYDYFEEDSEDRDVIYLDSCNLLFDDTLCLSDYVWKGDILIPSEMIGDE